MASRSGVGGTGSLTDSAGCSSTSGSSSGCSASVGCSALGCSASGASAASASFAASAAFFAFFSSARSKAGIMYANGGMASGGSGGGRDGLELAARRGGNLDPFSSAQKELALYE